MADFLRKPWIVDYLADGSVKRAKNVQILEISHKSEAIVVATAADSTHQIRLLFTKETLNLLRSEHDVTFRGAFFTLDDIESQPNVNFTEMFIFVRKLKFIGGDSNHPVQKTVKDASADPRVQLRLQTLRAEQEAGNTEGTRVDSQELVDAIKMLSDDSPNLPSEDQSSNQEWMPWPGFCYADCVIPPDQQAVLDALPGWDDSFNPQRGPAASPPSPHSDITTSGFVLSGEEPARDQHQDKAIHPRELGDFHREQAPPTAAGMEAEGGAGHANQEEDFLPSQDNSFLSQCYSQTHRPWNEADAAAKKAHAPATIPLPSHPPLSYTGVSAPASYVTAISKSLPQAPPPTHPSTAPAPAPETPQPSIPTVTPSPHDNPTRETNTTVQSPKPPGLQTTKPTSPVRSPQRHPSPHRPTQSNQPCSPVRNRTPERAPTPRSAQRQPTTPHSQASPDVTLPPNTAPPPVLSPLRRAAAYLLSPTNNLPLSAPVSVSRPRSRVRTQTPQRSVERDTAREKDTGSGTQERSLASRLASRVFGWVMGGSESNTETSNTERESAAVLSEEGESGEEGESRVIDSRSPENRKRAHSNEPEKETQKPDAKRQRMTISSLDGGSQIPSQTPPPIQIEISQERVETSLNGQPVLSQLSQHITVHGGFGNTQNENSWQDSYQFPIPKPPAPVSHQASQPRSQDHGSATTTQSEEPIPSATQSFADHDSGQSQIRASFEHISPAQHPMPDSQPPPPVLSPTPPERENEEASEPPIRVDTSSHSQQQQPIIDKNQSQSAAVSQNSNSFVTPAQRIIPPPAPVSTTGSDGAAITHVSESPLESSGENTGSRERTWVGPIPLPGLGLVTPHVRGEDANERGPAGSEDVRAWGAGGERTAGVPDTVNKRVEGERGEQSRGENVNGVDGDVAIGLVQATQTEERVTEQRKRKEPEVDGVNLNGARRARDAKRKEINHPGHRFLRPKA